MFIYPMAAMVLYIFLVGLYNFSVRFHAVKNQQLKVSHFRSHDMITHQVPERVVVAGRHFDNQFQLPMLFLLTLIAAQTMPLYNSPLITPLAWSFVFSRVAHGYIHLGANNVRSRALAYFAGWFLILGIWAVMFFQSV